MTLKCSNEKADYMLWTDILLHNTATCSQRIKSMLNQPQTPLLLHKQDKNNKIVWCLPFFFCSLIKFIRKPLSNLWKIWSWHISILIVIHSCPVTGVGGVGSGKFLCPESYCPGPIRKIRWRHILVTQVVSIQY